MLRQFSQSTIDDAWQFLVIKSLRWQQLRPEKGWRPIVCLELDGRPCHELTLGVDGQNPNLQNPAILFDASHGSRLHIHMYYQSQSKAKSKKKRKLVASTSVCLGETAERQGNDRRIELKLFGTPATRRKADAQKPQPCTSLVVGIKPPLAYSSQSSTSSITMVNDDDESGHTRSSSPEPMVDSPSDVSDEDNASPPTPPAQALRRRRRVKAFAVDSDEPSDCYISEDCSPSPIDRKPAPWALEPPDETEEFELAPPPVQPEPFILPNVLPLVRVNTAFSFASTSSLQVASSTFDAVTYYRELREAQTDACLEPLIGRMVFEWQYIGGSLLAVAALDTTVFGFNTSQTMFEIDSFAIRTLTVSAIAAALGLAVDAYLLFMFLGTGVEKFRARAYGVYNDYAFFALTSRLPLLSAAISFVALSLFLISVAFAMWPGAVLVMCAGAGVLVTLQYLVKGAELLLRGALRLVRAIVGLFIRPERPAVVDHAVIHRHQVRESRVGAEVVQMEDGTHIILRPAGNTAAP